MLNKFFRNKIKSKYRFKEDKNTACFVCDHVFNKERDILYVTHDLVDSSWQFLCGESDHTDNAKIISLEQATQLDNSINELFEMPEGVGAEREKKGGQWKPFRISD